MRSTSLAWVILCVLALASAAKDVNETSALLCDYAGKGVFSQCTPYSPGPKNSVVKKGGHQTLNVVEQWAWIDSWSSKKNFSFDLSDYSSISIDVRVDRPAEEIDVAYIEIGLDQWQGGQAAPWLTLIERAKIPADGRWHRIRIPIASLVAGLYGRPKPEKRDRIYKVHVAVTFWNEARSRNFPTDVRNFIAWKQPVEAIEIVPAP